jgi:hypothetical protein
MTQLRYANNSNYKNDEIITREVFVNKAVIEEFKRIVLESEVRRADVNLAAKQLPIVCLIIRPCTMPCV